MVIHASGIANYDEYGIQGFNDVVIESTSKGKPNLIGMKMLDRFYEDELIRRIMLGSDRHIWGKPKGNTMLSAYATLCSIFGDDHVEVEGGDVFESVDIDSEFKSDVLY